MATKVQKLEARKAALLAKIDAIKLEIAKVDDQIDEAQDPALRELRRHQERMTRFRARKAEKGEGYDLADFEFEEAQARKAMREAPAEAARKARLAALLEEV